jgi:hypothetical protein
MLSTDAAMVGIITTADEKLVATMAREKKTTRSSIHAPAALSILIGPDGACDLISIVLPWRTVSCTERVNRPQAHLTPS